MSSPEHKQKIWNYIKDIKVGMLATKDGEDLHARPMVLVQDEYDGRIWFFTKLSAEKVFETMNAHKVCVTFSDHEESVYVSLSGDCRISQDQELIDKFWNPFVAAWFEGGREDPEVALLDIKIYQGEHWDSKSDDLSQLYEVAKANVTGKEPDIGENEKFGT